MAFSIVKVYKESFPNVRFIGKKYTDNDRVNGTFGVKWGEWFSNGWFDILEKEIKLLPKEYEGNAYLGLMRMNNGVFEYYIGMFAAEDSQLPLGFEYIDIPAGEVATAWVHGTEDTGELYGSEPTEACISKFNEKGWTVEEGTYFFERYQCPRFTTPDKDGKVILDYCVYINV